MAQMENGSTALPPQAPLPRFLRFGIFEADARSGELRKNGVKVRIQEQPFQILLMLLERPGEVVSREELRQRLWSNDTFVDFDHGLNTAINKLREALGDAAGNPRFVETLARRGYRFIAPVRTEPLSASQSALAGNQAPAHIGPSPAPGSAAEAAEAVADAPSPGPTVRDVRADASAPPATASEDDLPRPARGLTRTLFLLVQLMYLVFYVVALTRLEHIRLIVGNWRSGWGLPVMIVVLITATVGIALRLYLLTAAAFDYQQLGRNFRKLFPVILPLDQLWALAPFLLPQIAIGAAFAACAALLYLPFSERTLMRMAYRYE